MSLMHAITNSIFSSGASNLAQQNPSYNTMLAQDKPKTKNQTIFNGRIQVDKVANGYVINIATREGYEFETYVALTIQEVNERIAASMVSFQLEGK